MSIYHRLISKKCFQVIRAVSINVRNFCRLSGFFFTVPKVFNEDAISHSFGTEDQNSFIGDPIFFSDRVYRDYSMENARVRFLFTS